MIDGMRYMPHARLTDLWKNDEIQARVASLCALNHLGNACAVLQHILARFADWHAVVHNCDADSVLAA